MNAYWVVQSKTGRKLGPYKHVDAKKAAADLNDYVLRNTGRNTKPFVVTPVKAG